MVWYHRGSEKRVAPVRHFEYGGGNWKALAWTAVLVLAGYATFKIIPAYVANYQLVDKMQEQARFSVVNHYTEDQVRDAIYKTVQDLEIPVKRDQIKVVATSQIVKIGIDYTVPVDLMVYHMELHFTPSSENKSLW